MKVVLATGNPHKVEEISRALPAGIELVPQSAFGVEPAIEDGLSFVENAIIKARHASRSTGLPAIADDSGLEVDVLDGAPGIYSARYAGQHATDAHNNSKLLAALDGIPAAQRTARFQCVIAMLQHPADPTPLIAFGTFEGFILDAPLGDHGFGYDPLFLVPALEKSVAQLTPAQKDEISHRARALLSLQEQLAERLAALREGSPKR